MCKAINIMTCKKVIASCYSVLIASKERHNFADLAHSSSVLKWLESAVSPFWWFL